MLKRVVIIVMFVTLCISTGFAQAGPDTGLTKEIPRGKWWQNGKVAERMSLTPDEIEKLDAAYVQMRRKLIRLKSDVEMERFELENVLESQNMDENAVMKQFNALEKARSGLSKELFLFIVEVREILGLDRYKELKSSYNKLRRKRIHGRVERSQAKGKAQ